MHNYYFLLISNTGAADEVIFLAGAKMAQMRNACRAERERRGAECLSVLAVAVKARSHSDACLAVARGQYRAIEAA